MDGEQPEPGIAWRKNPHRRRAYLTEMAAHADWKPSRLAALCGISLRHLERYCREDFGMNPKEWLRRTRLSQAKELLLKYGHVGRVAKKLGYAHASSFSRDFLTEFGQRPAQFLRAAKPSPKPKIHPDEH